MLDYHRFTIPEIPREPQGVSWTAPPIDPTLVDEVWREMMSYPVGRIEAEAHAFLTSRPHGAAFAHAMIKEQAPVVQKVAFGLCFRLFKILEQSLGRPRRLRRGLRASLLLLLRTLSDALDLGSVEA